jgi:hypothetical protein
VPAQPEEEMAGAGTLISGLKPAPPASVASSGMAASLNAAPLGADDAGISGVAAGPDTVGLQMPDIVDVPNEDVVDGPNTGITGVPN